MRHLVPLLCALPLTVAGCGGDDAGGGAVAGGGDAALGPAAGASFTPGGEYELVHTSDAGVKYYVKPVPAAEAEDVAADDPNAMRLLKFDDGTRFAAVPVKDGVVVEPELPEMQAVLQKMLGEKMGDAMGNMMDGMNKAMGDGPALSPGPGGPPALPLPGGE